jgi:uncharacterized protein YaiE (UPF0345 family)
MRQPTRMEQLGNLLTAMIAVIVSGSSDLMVSSGVGPIPCLSRESLRAKGKYRGVITRVTSKLGVSRTLVRKVCTGEASSARVLAELLAEVRRVDGLPTQAKAKPLSCAELAQCRNGGRYAGIYGRVAKKVGCARTTIAAAARGEYTFGNHLTAIREEMAVMDALPKLCHLTSEEKSQFCPGGKYFGIYARVAKALGVQPSLVGGVGRGTATSQKTLIALRAEMTRIDAEIAAKKSAKKTGSAKA